MSPEEERVKISTMRDGGQSWMMSPKEEKVKISTMRDGGQSWMMNQREEKDVEMIDPVRSIGTTLLTAAI